MINDLEFEFYFDTKQYCHNNKREKEECYF